MHNTDVTLQVCKRPDYAPQLCCERFCRGHLLRHGLLQRPPAVHAYALCPSQSRLCAYFLLTPCVVGRWWPKLVAKQGIRQEHQCNLPQRSVHVNVCWLPACSLAFGCTAVGHGMLGEMTRTEDQYTGAHQGLTSRGKTFATILSCSMLF